MGVVTVKSNVTVPSMREPLIPVDPQVNFIPVNNIPESLQSGKFQNYIIFGNGKTGCDAVAHLINSGVDPSQISWVSPRDVWYFNRDGLADFYKAMDVFRKRWSPPPHRSHTALPYGLQGARDDHRGNG